MGLKRRKFDSNAVRAGKEAMGDAAGWATIRSIVAYHDTEWGVPEA